MSISQGSSSLRPLGPAYRRVHPLLSALSLPALSALRPTPMATSTLVELQTARSGAAPLMASAPVQWTQSLVNAFSSLCSPRVLASPHRPSHPPSFPLCSSLPPASWSALSVPPSLALANAARAGAAMSPRQPWLRQAKSCSGGRSNPPITLNTKP